MKEKEKNAYLASNCLKKNNKYVFKARTSCCWGSFWPLNIYILSFRNKSYDYLHIIVHQKSLRTASMIGFSVHNNDLNLCGQIKNSKWKLCRRKKMLNVGIKDFLCTNIIYIIQSTISNKNPHNILHMTRITDQFPCFFLI